MWRCCIWRITWCERRLKGERQRNRLTRHPGPLPVEGRGRLRRSSSELTLRAQRLMDGSATAKSNRMSRALSRRKFIASSALGTGVFWIGPSRLLGQEKVSANEKLNIGMVGTSNRAAENLSQ